LPKAAGQPKKYTTALPPISFNPAQQKPKNRKTRRSFKIEINTENDRSPSALTLRQQSVPSILSFLVKAGFEPKHLTADGSCAHRGAIQDKGDFR